MDYGILATGVSAFFKEECGHRAESKVASHGMLQYDTPENWMGDKDSVKSLQPRTEAVSKQRGPMGGRGRLGLTPGQLYSVRRS